MRESKLALQCTPVEPDSLLLEQMTMLAASSTAPTRSPWWQRALTKSGAAAIAGVLAISGAAYAERGDLAPIVKSMTGVPAHHEALHHPVRTLHPQPTVTPVTPSLHPSPSAQQASAQHADNRSHGRRVHGLHPRPGQRAGLMKQDGNQGGDQNQGNGNAYSRAVRGGQNGNAQSEGHDNKTGQNNASHGSSAGNPHSKGASNPQN